MLLHVPAVQSFIGSETSEILSRRLGTKVQVGRVDLGLLNRIIIDNVKIADQKGQPLLSASRVSAKFDVLRIPQGQLSISSAQLFGLRADLYQDNAHTPANYQFLLDSLSSKNPKGESKLNLRISSLVIRHGHLAYDRRDIPRNHRFQPQHLRLDSISGHLLLNQISNDSINILVKRLGFHEQSGLRLRELSFRLVAGRREARLDNFRLRLPGSQVNLPSLHANYRMEGKRLLKPTLRFEGTLSSSVIALRDFSPFFPKLKRMGEPLRASLSFRGTSTTLSLTDLQLQASNRINLKASGSLSNWESTPRWATTISSLSISREGLYDILSLLHIKPQAQLPQLSFTGEAGGYGKDLSLRGQLRTSLGDATLRAGLQRNQFNTHLRTSGLDLSPFLGKAGIGTVAADLDARGRLRGGLPTEIEGKGLVSRIDYKDYSYKNIRLDGRLSHIANQFRSFHFNGKASIDDPNLRLQLQGNLTSPDKANAESLSRFTADIAYLNPSALKRGGKRGRSYSGKINANFRGNTVNNAMGSLLVENLRMKPAPDEADQEPYTLPHILITALNTDDGHRLNLESDVARATLSGHFDYSTLPASIARVVAAKVPALRNLIPALRDMNLKTVSDNRFSLTAHINDSRWLNRLLGVPLRLNGGTATFYAEVDDPKRIVNLEAVVPSFTYDGSPYSGLTAKVYCPNDTLHTSASLQRLTADGRPGLQARLDAYAANDHLIGRLDFSDRSGSHPTGGTLSARTEFLRSPEGTEARIHVLPSQISVGDTLWQVHPSTVNYRKRYVAIDGFSISHAKQHIMVNGLVTDNPTDTLRVDLRGIDVAYVLNLINFDDVSFGGSASGTATLSNLFGKPRAKASLMIGGFTFEDGLLGNMQTNVSWNERDQQIDIQARAIDHINRTDASLLPKTGVTTVGGYVSPKRSDIRLDIGLQNSRMAFVGSLCKSFMDFFDVTASGNILLAGSLKNMQLTGRVVTEGRFNIAPLGTTYSMNDAVVKLVPNMMAFDNAIVHDRNGNTAIVSGGIPHRELHDLGYDIKIKANNFLSLDTHGFGEDTFYGTIYADGNAHIHGNGDEVNIDVDATPGTGSFLAYNAASPGSVEEQNFIHWTSRDKADSIAPGDSTVRIAPTNIPADMHLNIVANCNQNLTLKVVTDPSSGDYISLHGNGLIQANYFNKGNFQLFGNYIVDHGVYRLTIQNAIRREFQFQQGGTIAFGGDPFYAPLNLSAVYTVNGVSLSDLNMGRSFTSGNTRVNCLMNITGTPGQPKVDFSLDLPNVNGDVKQMVLNLINSQEEMNQQALYLLAVGRFFTQGSNNQQAEGAQRQNQTSLAMQSLLSGTISQQINNVLSQVVNNSNWNFGANISTGDEGFNNAEYEGLLNGRMLNNRLIFNGQFGYRDNANATSSFIGDFDLQYLLQPNGNLAIKVYNQTNDRYFTRNSLTTQGIGIIMKKDFNSLSELFRRNTVKLKDAKAKKKREKKKE